MNSKMGIFVDYVVKPDVHSQIKPVKAPQTPMPSAWFWLEDVLAEGSCFEAACWLGLRMSHFRQRAGVFSQLLTSRLPGNEVVRRFSSQAKSRSRAKASARYWACLRGMSQDRLEVLGDEFGTRKLIPGLRSDVVKLLDRAKAQGRVVVLLSEHIDPVVEPVASTLGVELRFCNQPVFVPSAGHLVFGGELRQPYVDRSLGTEAIHAFANQHGLDLNQAYGYDRSQRSAWLNAVGHRCVVAPQKRFGERAVKVHPMPAARQDTLAGRA